MPVPYDQDTSKFRNRVDEDVMKWWDTLQRDKPTLEKRQIQVSQQTLESSPIAFGRDVIMPQGEGEGGTPTICEGDFEGDYFGPDESIWDINVSLPYDITVVAVILSGTSVEASVGGGTQIGYGGEGESVSFIDFDEAGPGPWIGVGGDPFSWSCNQVVPQGGYLALYTGDWTDNDLVNGSIHYRVHYTYNCADAP